MHPLGVIHGRFQVLHNDHLRYLLAGKERCDHLVIGITNPDPTLTADESAAPERSAEANNPLTYFERAVMVRHAMLEAGVPLDSFTIVPLPINRPELIANYVPADAVYFLTIYDDWGREKKQRLEGLGLTTEVMWDKPESEKGITATQVREALRSGGDWTSLVPTAVAKLIRTWRLQERLAGSSGNSGS